MIVVRFVTETELQMYLSGARILNFDRHDGLNSTSVGSCFAEITPKRDADKWMRKLLFLRPCEYCIEFDTDKFLVPLNESEAMYCADDVKGIEKGAIIKVREWCTTSYSIKTHPFTRYTKLPNIVDILKGAKLKFKD